MIRRHLISAVGICAALAAGIALGGGPLSNHDTAASTPPAASANPALKSAAAFGQKWATDVGPDLYAGRLAGRRIALVTLPGAPAATVQQLVDGISVAKGVVSAHVRLLPGLLDPNRKVAADTLGEQYARQSHDTVDPRRPTYQRIGQMVGMAVARRWSAVTVQETLRAAKLASVVGGQTQATLVLVVLGPHSDPQIVNDLLWGLTTKVTGIVVAGSSSAPGSALAGVRQQKWNAKVMTVDGMDTTYGRTAVMTGLVSQLTPHGGSYGASGIDGLVPLG